MAAIWVKREGASSPAYGGNKVRTLEAWLGQRGRSARGGIWAIGAYGWNHASRRSCTRARIGLEAGVILFPQPASEWAIENAGALIDSGCPIVRLRSVVEVPFAADWRVAQRTGALARLDRDAARWRDARSARSAR